MLRRTTLPVALLIAILLALPAPPAGAARGMEVALQDDAVFLNQAYYGRERALEKARDLGVTRIRVNFLWARALGRTAYRRHAPSHTRYNWWPVDSLIDQAAAHGIRVHVTLTGPAPAYATGNHHVGVYRPRPAHFARFARAAAEHFKGRVDRYSIWNEPNWKSWLAPHASAPAIYRGLYLAGYRAVKSADPTAKVLIGETSPMARASAGMAPLSFLRAMTRGAHLRADGYAHHPYDYAHSPSTRSAGRGDVTIATLGRLTSELSRLARRRSLRSSSGRPLDVYLTEYGYFARGRHSLGERRRASYLARAFGVAYHNRRVRSMLQYLLVSPPGNVSWDTSLLSARGGARRAFHSLSAWSRHAAVARPRARLALPPAP